MLLTSVIRGITAEEETRLCLRVLELEDKVVSYCEVQDRLHRVQLLQLYSRKICVLNQD